MKSLKYDKDLAGKLYGIFAFHQKIYHRAEIYGTENIPKEGGALVVSNHGRMGLEYLILFKCIWDKTGRFPRGLGDHYYQTNPILKYFMPITGGIDGTRENAVKILKEGELAFCYPGGSRDIIKNSYGKEGIFWQNQFGFIKVALQAEVPVIPIASIGNNNGIFYLTKGKFLNKIVYKKLMKASSLYDDLECPLSVGMPPVPLTPPTSWLFPLPAKLRYYVGPPINLGYPPEAADDQEIVEKLQKRIDGILTEMLEKHAQKPLPLKIYDSIKGA
ncbi:MAG: lysophospholipid acyltransferase family protein [bacterium]|nr:lysophospholipid acyltransferase family protein [bacterium]